MSKLRNRKTVVDGIEFDSRKEARRYTELSLLEKAGAISDLRLQVKYVLIPAQYETYERYGKRGQRLKDGERLIEREIAYIADYVYTEDGKTVVEDVKGYRDPSSAAYAKFVLKRKLMLWIHGIKIKEV